VTLSVVTRKGGASVVRSCVGNALWLVWSCTGLLAFTWMACSSEPRQPQNPATASKATEEVSGEPCTYDADCASWFCDRGFCAEADETKGHYGWACESEPSVPVRQVNPCGGYLCIDQRCRSCQSDAECRKYQKGPTCAKPGDWPGKGCGDYSHAVSERAAPPPPPPSELPPE